MWKLDARLWADREGYYPLSPVFPNDRNHSSNIWVRGDDSLPDRSTWFGKDRPAHSEVPWHRSLNLSKENFKLDKLEMLVLTKVPQYSQIDHIHVIEWNTVSLYTIQGASNCRNYWRW